MQREEFWEMLNDPEICLAIYRIVQAGGKPLREAEALFPGSPAASENVNPKEDAPSIDQAKISALRARWRKDMQNKQLKEVNENIEKKSPEAQNAEEKILATPPDLTLTETASTPPDDEHTTLTDKIDLLRGHIQKKKEQAEKERQAAEECDSHDNEYTYVIERKCPVCERMTRVIKCKSRLIVEGKDLDFCVHYKEFNPYLYSVFACEHCGFAAEERRFLGYMPQRTRDKLAEFLAKNNMAVKFAEKRTVADAIAFVALAILFAELVDISPNRRAGLYLTMAWIYRYEGNEKNERECMQKAAELYDTSLAAERYPVGGMSDNTAIYLIGVLYYMLGDYDKSTGYLSRLIGDTQFRRTDAAGYARARDLWQDIKAARQEQKAKSKS